MRRNEDGVTTAEKIKALQKKLTGAKNQKFLADLAENGLAFGRFTDKQTVMIEELYNRAMNQEEAPVKKYSLGEIQPKEIAQCWDCGDSGFCRVVRKPEFEEWAKWSIGSAPCHCSRGRELIVAFNHRSPPIELGPQFNDNWKTSYEIFPAWTKDSGTVTNKEP